MASIREYFEKDFSNCLKLDVVHNFNSRRVEGVVLYDFVANIVYTAWYVEGSKNLDYFFDLLSSLKNGSTEVVLNKRITLPKGQMFPGEVRISNKPNVPFEVLAKFYGESEYISSNEMNSSSRIFIYSESDLTSNEKLELRKYARNLSHELQFRSMEYSNVRGSHESPLAFISHDWNDKDEIAKPIAMELQRLLCPVWYDEFSLNVGNNLRDSIEKGLKECKKCILVISPNFISNEGWTKTEFDSIFTRQILENQKLVLPVWYNVTKQQVYEYSPSLLNIFALDWNRLGEKEVCRQLYNAING